ncbi:MAG TPA: MFS transporter [Polyangiaceae bacterium]|jgi:ACS family hexuronate transporter-like MFS transporter|nr:MFS transporter [Polyangiaceae bacterium]
MTAPAKPALRRGEVWALSAATTFAMSISYVDRQTLSVLAPTITKALHISDAAYGWLGSGFSIAYLIGGPFAGVWIDRVGARRGLLAGLVLWSAVAALHALVPGFAVLFALRLALGLAESPTFPGGVQAIQRGLAPADRARGMSLLFVGMSLGGMLAPPIAIGVATRFGWRAAFLGTALLAAIWVPCWLAVTAGAATREALDDASTDGPRPTMLAVAAHPAVMRGVAGLLAIVPASAFALAWESKYYVRQFGLTQAALVPYLMASAVAYDLGAIAFGDLAARRARRRGDDSAPRSLVAVGAACAAVGLTGLAIAPDARVAVACFLSSAIGRGAVVTLCNTDALARVPRSAVSAAGGVIASVQSLGAIVVNPAVGHAVQGYGYPPALFVLAAWTVPCAAAWLLWPASRVSEASVSGAAAAGPND